MSRTRLLFVAIVATLFIPSIAAAQGRPGFSLCIERGSRVAPTLRPVDEAARKSDFAEFRRRLQDAVARKDEAAILAVVDPKVRISFDDPVSTQTFKTQVIDHPDQDFWREFGTILRLGGRFLEDDTFGAPYTYSAWPDAFDSFECLAITGSRVRVRAAPRLDGQVLTVLDYAIVTSNRGSVETPGWTGVQLPDGRTGFVSAQFVRSPVDHRALFQFHDGRWWLMAYVAGD